MSAFGTKVADLADQIWRDLGEPTDLAISTIAYWLRANVGALNNLISQNFKINSENEIDRVDPDDASCVNSLSINEAAILKKMYIVHFYNVKVRETLGAASTDSVVELESDGSRIRKINKNEQSKTYVSLKKTENEELMTLVNSYRSNGSEPIQVVGDDAIAGYYDTDNVYNRTSNFRR